MSNMFAPGLTILSRRRSRSRALSNRADRIRSKRRISAAAQDARRRRKGCIMTIGALLVISIFAVLGASACTTQEPAAQGAPPTPVMNAQGEMAGEVSD